MVVSVGIFLDIRGGNFLVIDKGFGFGGVFLMSFLLF